MNTSRLFLKKFIIEAVQKLTNNSYVLDAGVGSGIYHSLFSNVNYESTDINFQPNYPLSFISDLGSIPIVNNRYDLIICTQVLEHVTNPQDVINELFRVLKPGGELWLSAPFYFEEHEKPFDYYRFTKFGLTYLFESAGFMIVHLNELEGYYMTLAYQLKHGSKNIPINMESYGGGLIGFLTTPIMIFVKLLLSILSVLFAHLDARYKNTSIGHCKNYTIVGIKPMI